jgi:hypothetical protein
MDGTTMDARRNPDGRFSVHRSASPFATDGAMLVPMKDRRSKLLRAFVADIERAERWTKADEALFKRLGEGYPYEVREPVFCWLWANYDQVHQLRHWQGGSIARIGWEGIAQMMREEGVVGSRGDPPNANSVRRVWGRVCRKIEARAAMGR